MTLIELAAPLIIGMIALVIAEYVCIMKFARVISDRFDLSTPTAGGIGGFLYILLGGATIYGFHALIEMLG